MALNVACIAKQIYVPQYFLPKHL